MSDSLNITLPDIAGASFTHCDHTCPTRLTSDRVSVCGCGFSVVRVCAAEQFSLIAMRCSNNSNGLIFFINLLFSMLNGKAKENASNSQEYFQVRWSDRGYEGH